MYFYKMTTKEVIKNKGFYEEKSPLQRSSTRYEAKDCLYSGKTDYAETVIIENPDYGRMLFLDGELQSCTYDEAIYHETLVHPIMRSLSHIENKRVLVIGGAEGATVREVLRWPCVKRIDWVDIDRPLMRVCRQYLQYTPESVYNNCAVRFYAKDIMEYLLKKRRVYDCIIIDLPDPNPDELILYGTEFWKRIYAVLKTGGGIVTHCGPVEPGAGRQVGLSIVRAIAGEGFAYHVLIPSFQGEWGFWMSLPPSLVGMYPESCVVASNHFQATIFHWDRHWGVR
jgi:spermidine synthase